MRDRLAELATPRQQTAASAAAHLTQSPASAEVEQSSAPVVTASGAQEGEVAAPKSMAGLVLAARGAGYHCAAQILQAAFHGGTTSPTSRRSRSAWKQSIQAAPQLNSDKGEPQAYWKVCLQSLRGRESLGRMVQNNHDQWGPLAPCIWLLITAVKPANIPCQRSAQQSPRRRLPLPLPPA